MKIIPVMDILGGVCVHARAGRRESYRPVRSVLTADASNPTSLARAYHTDLGLETIYLADLNAILDDRPDWNLIARLAVDCPKLWVDAGTRSAQRAVALVEAGVDTVIIGLESLAGPDPLREIVTRSHVPRDRFLMSLDLFDGQPMFAEESLWPASTTLADVASVAADLGIGRFLIIDVARVGSGRGAAGEEWVEPLSKSHPGAEIWLGGGVKGLEDLNRLSRLPIAGALVASALHEGVLGIDALAALARNVGRSSI